MSDTKAERMTAEELAEFWSERAAWALIGRASVLEPWQCLSLKATLDAAQKEVAQVRECWRDDIVKFQKQIRTLTEERDQERTGKLNARLAHMECGDLESLRSERDKAVEWHMQWRAAAELARGEVESLRAQNEQLRVKVAELACCPIPEHDQRNSMNIVKCTGTIAKMNADERDALRADLAQQLDNQMARASASLALHYEMDQLRQQSERQRAALEKIKAVAHGPHHRRMSTFSDAYTNWGDHIAWLCSEALTPPQVAEPQKYDPEDLEWQDEHNRRKAKGQ